MAEKLNALQGEVEVLKTRERQPELEKSIMINLVNSEVSHLRRLVSDHQKFGLLLFSKYDGQLMICPVPIRSGHLMQLSDVYAQWKLYPSENEGTFYSTFICPYTGVCTSLASTEQVTLISHIASRLNVSIEPPFQFFYRNEVSMWIPFSLHDQISIASLALKIYRSGDSCAMEHLMVCKDQFYITLHVLEHSIDFQKQSTTKHGQTREMCIVFGGGPRLFFERWTFFSSSDVGMASSA